jgi:hypothetical protein
MVSGPSMLDPYALIQQLLGVNPLAQKAATDPSASDKTLLPSVAAESAQRKGCPCGASADGCKGLCKHKSSIA